MLVKMLTIVLRRARFSLRADTPRCSRALPEAINIQVPYNFERILYLLSGGDTDTVSKCMQQLMTEGRIALRDGQHSLEQGHGRSPQRSIGSPAGASASARAVSRESPASPENPVVRFLDGPRAGSTSLAPPSPVLAVELQQCFTTTRVTDDEMLAEMRRVWQLHRYIVDPHTAVAMLAARRLRESEMPVVTLATAHPCKFAEALSQGLGKAVLRCASQHANSCYCVWHRLRHAEFSAEHGQIFPSEVTRLKTLPTARRGVFRKGDDWERQFRVMFESGEWSLGGSGWSEGSWRTGQARASAGWWFGAIGLGAAGWAVTRCWPSAPPEIKRLVLQVCRTGSWCFRCSWLDWHSCQWGRRCLWHVCLWAVSIVCAQLQIHI